MNARTIQHPGIEINEIDLTEYRDTVTTNNAYVIGFTDRGPIYDYSWITTRSEFINLYGEPQNEAEKYLYYAVQSILNNGGTPIVARMPYDNKQCKAYKGLKIKYASVVEDKNNDAGFTILNWENDQQFSSQAEPLISLDQVGQYIQPEGFNTVLETLQNQEVERLAYPSNAILLAQPTGYVIPSGSLKELTYYDLIYNLSPQVGTIMGLTISSATIGENDYNLYSAVNKAISNIAQINAFVNVNAHPIELKTVSNIITSINAYNGTDGLSANLETISGILDTFKTTKPDFYGDIDINLNFKNTVPSTLMQVFDKYNAISGITDVPSALLLIDAPKTKNYIDKTVNLSGLPIEMKNNSPQTLMNEVGEVLATLRSRIIEANTIEGIDLSTYDSAAAELGLLKIYVEANTSRHDKHISGIINLLTDESGMFKKLNAYKVNPDSNAVTYTTLSSILNKYNTPVTSEYISATIQMPDDIFNQWSKDTNLSGWIDYYFTGNTDSTSTITSYTGPVERWLDVFTQEIGDSKLEVSEYYKKLRINGKLPAELGIPSAVIDNYAKGIIIPSGNLSATIGSFIPSSASKELIQVDKALALIYNDPYFKKLDGTLSGQAMVDAKLLTTPEINYKYGVYLDSKECSISNEQYDDLVTTNNFTKADTSVSKYGENIDNANFVIVDKQKTIVDGTGSNQGYFVTIIDPYDALKSQHLLINPKEELTQETMVSNSVKRTLTYWGEQSEFAWKTMFKNEINTMNTLQRVKNADGIWVGEVNKTEGKEQLLDSWSVPLTGNYNDESISKTLMNTFPQIPLTDVASNANSDSPVCTIDKQYSSHIVVAVCRTVVNPSDGKITVAILEQFFGSLFEEKNIQNGRDLYIGNIINANSNYIEFYRNNYIKPAFDTGYDPAPYNRTAVPQFFIKDSTQLNNACKMVGIDPDIYDVDNVYFDYDKDTGTYTRKPNCPALIEKSYGEYIADLKNSNIFVFNKKNTILYNNHPQAEFTSFSKKESQKIIANTTGLFGQAAGTTANIGDNFIIDMDRCINFIKNIDDIPIYFVADAGLSTIAQFCDNVVWDPTANSGNGKWVTQNFDPDNDPDAEDRYITGYEDVATWRKVVDKLDQISREIRRDCMTIIDAPRQLTLDGAAPKIRRSRPQFNWDEMVGEKLRFISGINSSYCAGYYNWLRTTDDFSGRSFWLPPTCKIIGNYMYLNIVNLPWLAPAGLSYGTISGIHGISHNPSPNEEDQIYLKSWNYIKQYPFDGFVIEGQKTTLTKNSAFNRVNVRTLFLDIERFVYNVARNFKYQVNNSYTREQFVQTIKPKLEDYMIRGGLYDYLIKCDDTNNTPETIDANELRCAIYLKPARLIEFIMIDMIAAKTGANFDEIVL